MIRIAALLTSHNRKLQTLSAIHSLFDTKLVNGGELSVFLVDDCSTDGTSEAVQKHFPQVCILSGTGCLFWNRGMRVAFAEALRHEFDYFLWLNDDSCLFPGALNNLLAVDSENKQQAVVIGSMCDPDSGVHTYGGLCRTSRWRPLRFLPVLPSDKPTPVDTMNGNFVLIPAAIARAVGNLDAAFTHGIGDFDYGLRARRLGFKLLIAPGYAGTCARNAAHNDWKNPSLPLRNRWKKMFSPRGLPPREWAIFAHRYAGFFWIIYWFTPYLRSLFQKSVRTNLIFRKFLPSSKINT